jgi:predicted Rossmann fold nucleotide-binding protein DprA/Smf involved in DNA uptake
VLFGAGSVELLSMNGLAVVGSRDVDAAGSSFASEIGARCAGAGLTVFSGAARGVDRLAMLASAEHAGTGVGVPADSLERMLRDRDYGSHIRDGRLALVTPFVPSAPFAVANAMSRNKLVYCLASYAVVVASSEQNGGTWAGAIENLRSGWVPLFVRNGPDSPKGNLDLVSEGGIPLPSTLPSEATGLLAWLKAAEQQAHADSHAAPSSQQASANRQMRLFGDPGSESTYVSLDEGD